MMVLLLNVKKLSTMKQLSLENDLAAYFVFEKDELWTII